ncbi:MAG: DUF4339 domain-containing protein [Sphingomonadales bacterium]|nr:DUF4339 domain-containing protein [Bacteroidota bacterium]MBM3920773.1 DUF4339 domain-containing protein [Sphingomonadales bacterium]
MALNLNKGDNNYLYYYTRDGVTFGPFTRDVLIEKIGPETLVYRDGIEWTLAKNIPELRVFFPNANQQTNYPDANSQAKNTQNNAKPLLSVPILILILLIFIVFLIIYLNKNNDTTTPSNHDSISAKTEIAHNKVEDSIYSINNSDSIEVSDIESSGEHFADNTLFASKNMIDDNPNTWWTPDPPDGKESFAKFNLKDGYYDVYKIRIINGSYGQYYNNNSRVSKIRITFSDGNSETFNPIETQDYQTLNLSHKYRTKFIKIEILNTNVGNRWNDLCISEIKFYGDYAKDQTDNNTNLNPICSDEDCKILIENMFNDLSNGQFDANNYFNYDIEKYINLTNTNPESLNRTYSESSDFVNTQNTINSESFKTYSSGNACICNFKSSFTCYRPSKSKWQKCDVQIEIKLINGKISRYEELSVTDLRFSNSEHD